MASDKVAVSFKPSFVRQAKKLPPALREEVLEKIELFQKRSRHSEVRVHKLHGQLAGPSSFSVNYRYRVVFEWEGPASAVLLAVGDHAVYE